MASLRITLLGGFEARLGSGEAVALAGRKSQALLAYLALPPGEPRSRDKLVGLLWSDRGEQQARGSLRQALAELRKALGDADPPPLVAGRDAVHLDAGAVEVDAVEFERLVADGAPEALERAAELYQGDLLDGIGVHDPAFEDWLRTERERLHERAREAMSSLLDHETSAGNTDQAVATARRLLALDPLQESTHRALMKLYADQGDRAMALRQYQACQEVLKVELGIEPDAETERLHQEIRREQPAAPAAREDTTDTTAGARESEGLPLPDKPSVAVLPFVNMSGDPEQEYFSDGITEDIITELSRFSELFVIARNSSFSYKGKSVKVQDIGRDLGVAYVVEGSVRKAGNRVRVTAQLVEAGTGNHVWVERYDRDLEDIFEVQDEITRAIVSILPIRLHGAAIESAHRKPTQNLTAYDYFLRGRWVFVQSSGEDRSALDLLAKAVEIDPRCAHAYAFMALIYAYSVFTLWPMDEDPIPLARANIERALAIDDADSFIHAMAGDVYIVCGDHDLAKSHIDKALAINPNDIRVRLVYGEIASYSGDPSEGERWLVEALRLDPNAPNFYFEMAAECRYMLREYEAAIEIYTQWQNPPLHMYTQLAASYAQLGRMDEARAAFETYERLRPPDADFAYYLAAHVRMCKRQEDADHWIEGYRKAGLPV